MIIMYKSEIPLKMLLAIAPHGRAVVPSMAEKGSQFEFTVSFRFPLS